MSTETAPDSCPFCKSMPTGVPQVGVMVFRCGTVVSPGNIPTTQTDVCKFGERERLIWEASERKATIKRLEAEKAFLAESHLAQENKRLVAEMLELRNAIQRDTDAFLRLTRERDAALARVKHLESEWAGWPDLQREWFGDKYAAMQPLEAVRARIEDTEARVQRLEEAGAWQPIETALTDMTWVIGYDAKDGEVGTIIFDLTGDADDEDVHYEWTDGMRTWHPTHWMPIPDPPKAKEAKP